MSDGRGPLTAEDYRDYVAAFNGRDYDALCAFFAPDVVLEIEGMAIRGRQGIRDFYAFFHAHVRETVTLRRFIPGPDAAFAHVSILFEGFSDLTQKMLDERGYGRMTPVPAGGSVSIDFFILYEQGSDGLIHRIRGTVFTPPA
jgi:hypothetical protein